MKNDLFFSETQKFKQWWLWLILILVAFFTGYHLLAQLGLGHSSRKFASSDLSLLVSFFVVLAVFSLLLLIKLETEIRRDGVYVKFFPFHRKYIHYSWDEISRSYVRKYNAILEYGGWGVRLGLFGKGRALNVSGNKGLQLEFYDKRKLLIGTQMPDEITAALLNMNKLNE